METDPNCIFCKIVVGQMPCSKLLEDDDTLAFMDIYPANDGHCHVIAKEHYPTLFDIGDQTLAAVSRFRQQSRLGGQPGAIAGRIDLVQANGPGAQQSVAHFHIHVLPRKQGDDLKLNWGAKSADPKTIAPIAEKIRAKL